MASPGETITFSDCPCCGASSSSSPSSASASSSGGCCDNMTNCIFAPRGPCAFVVGGKTSVIASNPPQLAMNQWSDVPLVPPSTCNLWNGNRICSGSVACISVTATLVNNTWSVTMFSSSCGTYLGVGTCTGSSPSTINYTWSHGFFCPVVGTTFSGTLSWI